HFSATELRETYAVLDGRVANPASFVRRLRIGAVIVDRHRAIAALRTHGFELAFRTPAGSYLVKKAKFDDSGGFIRTVLAGQRLGIGSTAGAKVTNREEGD